MSHISAIVILDNELSIADIFIFEDSAYYFSIVEESTGRGAMELLANPYTKEVFPEYGPNMMWNLKYGMHNNGGMMGNQRFSNRSGMMTGRGILGNTYDDDYFDKSSFTEDNEIDDKESFTIGEAYLMNNNNEFTLGEEYHDWHGELIEIIEGHGDDVQ
ncbi:MAG: hypothetical protein CVU98_13580 [Firmicutes bacterium HGW-Firmicutes-3]|jgi:hypothetical protein|nr:MAG: hypothetical protein CVU98_13580 [Firmicutes bacterium HGW-Firmicutes-3]